MKLTKTKKMDFSFALFALKEGNRVAREDWNGKRMYVELQTPTDTSKMTRPYLYMKAADDSLVPWVVSQSDLLAEDWVLVE